MKNSKAITLISLVLTIIILLILTAITVNMVTGENGIIKNTNNAKEQTEIANEKEIIQKATVSAMNKDKYGDLKQDELQNQLDKEQEEKTEVTDVGEEFEILFKESNRYYTVDKDGSVSNPQKIVKDSNPGDITKGGTLDGSEEKPYEINCIEDLVVFSNMTNGTGVKFENGKATSVETSERFSGKKIILKRDLNFKSKYSYINSERTDFGDINGNSEDGNTLINEMTTGTGFMPISIFGGKFDGEKHKIQELYEYNEKNRNSGLFGNASSAIIENIQVSGNIKLISTVSASLCVGGIVGRSWGYIEINNCTSNVKIETGGYGAGGIVGRAFNKIKITNCNNGGEINNKSDRTGGIIGSSDAECEIYNSYNTGKIKGDRGTGGIVGLITNQNILIENVYNIGLIDGTGRYGVGGIAGDIENIDANIVNAYNLGKVVSGEQTWSYKGGAIGYICDDYDKTLNIKDVYYLKNTADTAVGKKIDDDYGIVGLDKIENEEIVKLFNNYIVTENKTEWKKWKVDNNSVVFE